MASQCYTKAILIAEQLRRNFKGLSISDSLKIAVEINRNEILKEAFITGYDTPTALEAIAIALGFKPANDVTASKESLV